jgi:hypothetical protein
LQTVQTVRNLRERRLRHPTRRIVVAQVDTLIPPETFQERIRVAKVFRSRSWTPGRSRRGGVTSASTTPVGSRRRCFPQFTRPALGRLGRRPTHLADCSPAESPSSAVTASAPARALNSSTRKGLTWTSDHPVPRVTQVLFGGGYRDPRHRITRQVRHRARPGASLLSGLWAGRAAA